MKNKKYIIGTDPCLINNSDIYIWVSEQESAMQKNMSYMNRLTRINKLKIILNII